MEDNPMSLSLSRDVTSTEYFHHLVLVLLPWAGGWRWGCTLSPPIALATRGGPNVCHLPAHLSSVSSAAIITRAHSGGSQPG